MAGSDSSTTPNGNRNYVSSDGRSSTFDRGLKSYLKDKQPFNYSVLETEEDQNTKWKYFQKVGMRRPEAVAKNSVALSNEYNNTAFSAINQDRSFGELMYASVSEDKPGRLRDYRTIAAFSEVADALDEICDSMIVEVEGTIMNLTFINTDLESTKKEEVDVEFRKYVKHYDLKNKGWEYFRQFLIEGELYFEQIIHEDYTNEGILAVVPLPSDLLDPIYGNIQNMLIKGYLYKKPIFDRNDPKKVERYEFIPFEENQVVYCNSGMYNETKDFVVPFIENCRRSYRQLSMVEDSIIIHRMVHAPLRFVFNVDVGRLPVQQAETYLRKIQSQYWASKTFDIDQHDIVKKYSPQSTLDSYWFAKRQGQDPTTVSTIGGNTNLGAMDDLLFFVKKLYRSLKVPSSRLDPEDANRDGTDILREELKFANMVIRQQKKLASAIKAGFITHLKLRQMFEEYDLSEENVDVDFNLPSNFYDLRENQKLELKLNNFNNISGNENISATFAMKKYLKWTDREILANREFMRKDAEMQWELEQIRSGGPNWKEALVSAAQSGMTDGGMPGTGGSALPPAFGGEPAALGELPPTTPPEAFGGEPNTTPPPSEGTQEPLQ